MVRHRSIVREQDFPNLFPRPGLFHKRKRRGWDTVLLAEARSVCWLTAVAFKDVSPEA